jgi:hypothetical protein
MNGVGLPQTSVWLEISEGTGREGERGRERVKERGRGRVCDRDASLVGNLRERERER